MPVERKWQPPEACEVAPGDSAEQRECESIVVSLVSEQIGVPLTRTRIALPGGSFLEVDGCSADQAILCEAWAHQGSVKPAQKAKVITDAAKLHLAGQVVGRSNRKIIAFADDAAAAWFRGRSWMAQALVAMNVEVMVVDIPEDVRNRVRLAQTRQFR